jgi:SAM-dependent methyltransferase
MSLEVQALFDSVFGDLPRQAPGSRAATLRAYEALPPLDEGALALDVGCGAGGQTRTLAEIHPGPVIAFDLMMPFMRRLRAKNIEGVSPACMSMDAMAFAPETFDLVWSEGALYSIGFDAGVRACRDVLKPGSYLAATEMVWFGGDPPQEAQAYFAQEYADIRHQDAVADAIQQAGFELLDSFALPGSDWWDDYYTPLEAKIDSLRAKFADNNGALGLINGLEVEIDIHRKYGDAYGYAFYVCKRT